MDNEQQYIDLIQEVLNNGQSKSNTISIFGHTSKYSLHNNKLPIITSRYISFNNIIEELLWFISGNTNSNMLKSKIWDYNGSRKYLDSIGLINRDEGDLGPIYGFQLRHYGATYNTCNNSYNGIDQLTNIINEIKINPNSRRLIINLWNPIDIDKMVLPPCHCFIQFNVNNGELNCQLYQRSADIALGLPYNITSYSLLTHIISKLCGLKPGYFIHTLGDAHIYNNHISNIKKQIKNKIYEFPTININMDNINSIDDLKISNFKLINYNSNHIIKYNIN